MVHSRRTILTNSLIGLVAYPTLAGAAPHKPARLGAPSKRDEVVRSVFAAWRKLDVEMVGSHLSDDIVWHNSGGLRAPVIGKQQVKQKLRDIASRIQRCNWHVLDSTEAADRVWIEGLDDLVNIAGRRVVVPFMAIWDFNGDQIAEWRDFSNPKLREALTEGEPIPAHLEQLLARAAANSEK